MHGEAVGARLTVGEAVVGDRVRASGADWTGQNLEAAGDPGDAGRVAGVSQVSQLIDAHRMVIGGEKNYVIDVVVGDELEQLIAFGPVTAIPMFGNSESLGQVIKRNLVDRAGDGNKLPGDALCLGVQQTLFEPSQLGSTQHGPVGVIRTGADIGGAPRLLDLDVAVGAIIQIEQHAVLSPGLGEIKLLGPIATRVVRGVHGPFADRLLVVV